MHSFDARKSYVRTGTLLAFLAAASCASPGGADLRLISGETRVIAHRGGTGPDGTVAGCLRTMADGVAFLELDVRLTRDGHAVILHDPTVDRTTDGSGSVERLTLAEVKRLDAGVKYASAYAGERIPTVLELLRAVGPRAVVLLELKVPQAAEPVLYAIQAADAFDRAVVRTFDKEVLRKIRDRDPRFLTGTMGVMPDFRDIDQDVKELQSLGVRSFTPQTGRSVIRPLVDRFHAAGIAVWGTNTNDETQWRRLIDAGVDGIITDRPAELTATISTTLKR
jgi:glycerophosphoryl diester phosphodiesterase